MKEWLSTITFGAIIAGIVGLVGAVLITIFFQGCWVSEAKVVRALENQGFTQAVILDKDVTFIKWRGCSDSDDAAYQVRAINPIGKEVEVVACAGWPLKGVTVRTD